MFSQADFDICYYARDNKFEKVAELLRLGPNPIFINEAMIFSASNGHLRIVELCHAYGGNDINGTAKKAAWHNQKEIMAWCQHFGITNINSVMGGAARGGHEEMFDLFLSLGADINASLVGAGAGGHIELFKRCIDLGANDYQKVLKYLFAPKATDYQKEKEIAKICIEHGANLYDIALCPGNNFSDKEKRDEVVAELRLTVTSIAA